MITTVPTRQRSTLPKPVRDEIKSIRRLLKLYRGLPVQNQRKAHKLAIRCMVSLLKEAYGTS